jgi:hypothetical protein
MLMLICIVQCPILVSNCRSDLFLKNSVLASVGIHLLMACRIVGVVLKKHSSFNYWSGLLP